MENEALTATENKPELVTKVKVKVKPLKRYSQRFRLAWLTDDRFKHWLQSVEGNDTKCFCKFCHTTLTAKFYDIENHRKSEKHKKATMQEIGHSPQLLVETQIDGVKPPRTGCHFANSAKPRRISRTTASGKRYSPSLHQPATQEELQQISDDLDYRCSYGQLQAITGRVNETLHALKSLDTMCDPVPEVKYPRTPGYRPKPEDRFGNAWVWRCDIAGAPSGKLFGKSVAITDNTAVAGVPMSNGSQLLEGYIPEYDASVVTRILDAGGRIVGKAACDDFCFGAMGFSAVDGYISNPENPEQRVGGSSGGSAVLVAAGQVDLAIGADQSVPAAWTGTVSLKPTYGLVPYTGVVSVEPTVDHVGPIARNVADCALFLEVIAGNDSLDGRQAVNIEVPEYSKLLEVNMTGKVIGVLQEGFHTCTQETQAAVREFLATVGQVGFVMKHISVPLHLHALTLLTAISIQGSQTMFQMGSSGQFLQGFYPTTLEKAVRQGLQTSAGLLAPGIKFYSMAGEFLTRRYGNHYYCKARNITLELTYQYEEVLRHCDVIVMPTLPHTATDFPQTKDSEADSLNAYLEESTDLLVNTAAANLTGHPALTLPLGKHRDGSADSLMIVGRKYDELTVLQVARALEKIIQARN